MKTYRFIGLLTVAVFFACTKGEITDIVTDEQEESESVVTTSHKYVLSVNADVPSGTKALELSLDGNTITPSWEIGEEVDVYATISEVETKVGVLTAQSSGPSTQLKGELDLVPSFEPAVNDVLTLWFNKGDSTTPYAGQDGTFATIASTFDRAKATVSISAVSGDVITISSNAVFSSQQSISKFTFNQPVKYAVIIAGDASVKENIVEVATQEVAGEYPTEIFVAIPKVGSGAQSYNIYVGNESGAYKAVKTANLVNGKYYAANVDVAAADATLLAGTTFNVALKKTVNPSFSGTFNTDQNFSAVNKKINFMAGQRNHVEGTLVSIDGSVPVWAYIDGTEGMKIVTMAPVIKTGTSMSSMFANITGSLNEIGGLTLLDTSEATSMSSMFYRCGNYNTTTGSALIAELDLSGFNTANVTSMESMFYQCGVKVIDVTGFNTANVLYMDSMFYNIMGLTTINGLNSFNTSNVKNMSRMFAGLYSMTALDLSTFDTSKVTNMSYMFGSASYYPGFTALDLSNFDSTAATDISHMFDGCTHLASLTLGSNFKCASATNMSYMFYKCSSLTSLNLNNITANNVTTMESMFDGCTALATINMTSSFVPSSKLTNLKHVFYDCNSLTNLNNFTNYAGFASVTTMDGAFKGCSSLTSLDFRTSGTLLNVTNFMETFSGCTKLQSLNFGTKKIKSTASNYNALRDVGKESATGQCEIRYSTTEDDGYLSPKDAFEGTINTGVVSWIIYVP